MNSNQTESSKQVAMTANQRRFSENKTIEMLNKYKEFVVGTSSFLYWICFELYSLTIAPLPSVLGLVLRRICLRFLLGCDPGSSMVSSSVTIRNPKRICFGKNVVIDRNVTLDVRESELKDEFGIRFGDNVFIGSGTMILAKRGSINLGSAVNISSSCRIASEGKIEVGESCLISAYCYLGPGNHRFHDKDVPIMEQGMEQGTGLKIGKNVWIGARVTILDGVKIGDNAIIGAHSFVKDDVPENTVVAGVPAKVIKVRT